MPSNIIILSDRIKELSNTLGTTNMQLEGAAVGFSAFGDFYSHNDLIFYAITDGTSYEVGSGQYQENTYNELVRYPFRSTSSDGLVSWPEGVKEIYVTYPATHSVYTASGLDVGYNAPQASGLAFWESEHILNYDSGMVWDSTNKRIGLNQSAPVYAIEIGGEPHASIVHASGFIADSSGVFFPSGNSVPSYSGGRQLEHFLRNELDSVTGTSAVFQLSGVVDERLLFQKQAKGHVLAGPPSGCGDGCSPDYPSFRYLTLEDLPDLSSLYVIPHNSPAMSGVAFWHDSGVLSYDPYFVYDTDTNYLGVNVTSPTSTLDVGGNTNIRGSITVNGNADVHGTLTYINSSTVTLGDKNLELGSLSGVAVGDDSLIDGGGITVLSTDGNKEWKWVNSTDAWTTAQKIDVSGIVGLQAGSGLTLRENSDGQLLLIDIDDMFSLTPDGGSPSYAISQADNIVVSGVKGITTTITSDGTTHSVIIDPTALSGQLASEISAGGGGGYAHWVVAGDTGSENILDTNQVTFAGGRNVETTYTTATNILSIDASGYIAAPGSGVGLATSAYGPSGQFYLDDPANLTGGQVNESDIVTQSAFEMLVWDDSASLWKYITVEDLQDEIDTGGGTTYTAVPPLVLAGTEFTLKDPNTLNQLTGSTDAADDKILLWDEDAVGGGEWKYMTLDDLPGYGGGEANENSFETIEITNTDSGYTWGLADVVAETATDTVKIVAGTNITLASDFTNGAIKISSASSSSGSAGSGLIKMPSAEFRIEPDWLNVTFGHPAPAEHTIALGVSPSVSTDSTWYDAFGGDGVDWGNDDCIAIGNTALGGAKEMQGFVAVGVSAGSYSTNSKWGVGLGYHASSRIADSTQSVAIGRTAMQWASGCKYSVSIGSSSSNNATGCINTNAIGYLANYRAIDSSHCNMIGTRAGGGAIDNSYCNMIGYYAGAGHGTLSLPYGAADSNYCNMIGFEAGWSTTGTDYTNMIGYQAGKVSLSCDYTSMIGHKAGYSADDCNNCIMIGDAAGAYSSGCGNTVMIGNAAGVNTEKLGYSVLIGYKTGYDIDRSDSSDTQFSTFIGYEAGYEAHICDDSIGIGRGAGYQTQAKKAVMIGPFAGWVSHNHYGVMIGNSAGEAAGIGTGVLIGYQAGKAASSCGNIVAIGSDAAGIAKAASGVMIGHWAGFGAGTSLRTEGEFAPAGSAYERGGAVGNAVFIGEGAGFEAENSEYVTLIGTEAGSGIQNSNWLDMMGYKAGIDMHNCSGIVAIGRSAGRQAGRSSNGFNQIGNVDSNFFGRFAGRYASDNHEVHYMGYKAGHEATGVWQQVCIGSQAGIEMDGAQSGVFIGYKAGKQNGGIYNLSILANGGHGDEINGGSSNYKFNIANVIAGDHSDGDVNLPASVYKKRVSIGDVTSTPAATLQISPMDIGTTVLQIGRPPGGSSKPAMIAKTQNLSYNGATGNGTNHIISKHGFLRLPIFNTKAHLLGQTPTNHAGEMAMYFNSTGSTVGLMAYCDGTKWRNVHNAAIIS